MTIRSFLAFPISGELKEKFEQILCDLQHTPADVKWVKPENIHLTLKFLGDLKKNDIEKVVSVVKEQCRRFQSITTYLNEIGAFPDLHHPKIVWGGIDDPDNEIQKIVEILENELVKLGIAKDDHPFKAHITLGRVKSSKNLRNLIETIQQITIENKITQTFERIILYKSTLTSEGPIYEILEEFKWGESL